MVCVNANKDWHSLKNNNNKKERERGREAGKERKLSLRAANCNLKQIGRASCRERV